jgi:hypothetical protein
MKLVHPHGWPTIVLHRHPGPLVADRKTILPIITILGHDGIYCRDFMR